MSLYNNLEKYYNIVYDQAFSPNTKYLAVCDRYGKIGVFSLASASNLSSGAAGKVPISTLTAHSGSAYCLETAGNLLFSGGEDGIKAWKWSDLTKTTTKDPQPVATLTPPSQQSIPETNCLAYDNESHTLYSGCGDNNIYGWDVTTGKIKSTLTGHKDYVHCLCLRNGREIVSGGEDGTVRIWDPSNSKKLVHTINKVSQWVGCVAVDDSGDWLVCGGPDSPSIFHLSTLSKVASLQTPKDVVTQTVVLAKDRIITAGSETTLRHWTISGDLISSVPSTHTHAFSLAHNTNSQHFEVLTVSGDSSDIQVFTNFGYRAFSLTM